MDCNKWESTGLLFVAKELDKKQVSLYIEHCRTCTFCSQEVAQYESDKVLYFTPNLLSISTPPDLDAKVLSLCTTVKQTSIGMFSAVWVKRVVFSALVFAFGAGAGGYFSFAYYHSKSVSSLASVKRISPALAPVLSSSANRQMQPAPDTSKSDANVPSVLQKSVRSPMARQSESQGIITVDVKKE